MTTQPNHNITCERATDILKVGKPLCDVYVAGEIKIETTDNWDKEVIIENCIIESFSGSVTPFEKPVTFRNSHFKKCRFVFTYFLGGLIIENCTFDDYLDFQAGGHNKTGNPVLLSGNVFNGFVNFMDCWYENEVTIRDNEFHDGTNLLGKPFAIPVTFDVPAIIENNSGQLDFDTEGTEITTPNTSREK